MWGWVKPLLEVILNFFWERANDPSSVTTTVRNPSLRQRLLARVRARKGVPDSTRGTSATSGGRESEDLPGSP